MALRNMKDNLDDALHIDYATALHREAERLVQASRTEDHKEAVRAFVEKTEAGVRRAVAHRGMHAWEPRAVALMIMSDAPLE